MSTEISGVGQPGFVGRYGLGSGSGSGRDAAAEEVAARIREPDGQDVSDWEMREYFEFF